MASFLKVTSSNVQPGLRPSQKPRLRSIGRQTWAPRSGVRTRVAAPANQGAEEREADREESCSIYIDKDGSIIPAMCCDYGFRSGSGRLYQDQYGEVPDNIFAVAWKSFQKEFGSLRRSFRQNEYGRIAEQRGEAGILDKAAYTAGGALVSGLSQLDEKLENSRVLGRLEDMPRPLYSITDPNDVPDACKEILGKLRQLKLDDALVTKREHERVAVEGDTGTPFFIKLPFLILCWVLDVAYKNRPIQRFWTLEVVARIPYFAYISILHLYESIGFWRAGAELRKVHFAEEWNEMHHLQIMESLGGDTAWVDRFVAEHTGVLYYWMLITFYLFSPRLAYNFMELVELHAMDTYASFVEQNEALLKTIPPPMVAIQYYKAGDLYLFDTIRQGEGVRRPDVNNLYDVFSNIRDDESEHVKTMRACQTTKIADELADRRKNGK